MQVLRYLALFAVWNVAVSLALWSLPSGPGLAAMLALTAAAAWAGLPRTPGGLDWRMLRVRPLRGASLRWTLAAVPALLAFSWAFGDLYVRLVPVPPENFDPLSELIRDPLSRVSVTLFAVGIGPVLEELVFRGAVQRDLERRWGAVTGITVVSLVFAAVHGRIWIFPLYFFLGMAFGWAVYVTRSVWAGVILHVANNASAMVGYHLHPGPPEPLPTLWTTGPNAEWWSSVTLAILFGLVLAQVARGLWRARPVGGLRHAVADG